MLRWPLLVCAGFGFLLTLLPPVHSQNGTGILMDSNLVLRAGPPLQLSLNAGVSQFLYQPTGDHIAYVSLKDNGTTETASVQYVTTHHADPDTVTLFTIAGESPAATPLTGDTYSASLMNWSSDGRYLPFEVDDFPNAQNEGDYKTDYYIADTGAVTSAVQVRHLPTFPTPDNESELSEAAWSPSQTRLLIFQTTFVTGHVQALGALYDPADGDMHVLQIPTDDHVLGWQDNAHVLLRSVAQPEATSIYYAYDVATDTTIPIPHATIWPPVPQSKAQYSPSTSTTTPKAPGLTLETDQKPVLDPQGVAYAPVWTVWLRRAAAPKAMSALAIGVAPIHLDTPSPNNADNNDPQAQWSPDGDAVAYLAHGDLFVVSLTKNDATPYEKIAAGEKLDCAEEKQIIEGNLKQIGLGLIQYAQDNNEKYPATADWQNAVYPYLKDNSLFNFAGIPINYSPPQDLSLASMDSPATEPLATADTPCAHIVLFADGHVKAFNKDGN